MNTTELLDKLNGAIAEHFTKNGLLNKKANFGDCHAEVREAIAEVLPHDILEYHIWTIGPQTRTANGYEFAAHDVELFKLTTAGFEHYKGSAGGSVGQRLGKWLRAPRYEVMASVSAPTVGEIIRRGMRQKFEKLIHEKRQSIAELEKSVTEARGHLDNLIEQFKVYDLPY